MKSRTETLQNREFPTYVEPGKYPMNKNNTKTETLKRRKESIMTENKTIKNQVSRNQEKKGHGKRIFKRPIRYTIYIIFTISMIIGISDYDAITFPEGLKYQLIALISVILCTGMMYHHTRLFDDNCIIYEKEEER